MFPEKIKDDIEETEAVEDAASDSILNMSDEEVGNISFADFVKNSTNKQEAEVKDSSNEEETAQEDTTDQDEEDEKDTQEEIDYHRNVYQLPVKQEEESEEDDTEEDENEQDESTEEVEEVAAQSDKYIDYKAEYQKIFEPFKASGREIKVSTVDDARRLMQMGVDYSKKMQALKPHLRIMKALENNKLLDQNVVNHFIDIAKGKPEAIAKLLKDKDIDPMSLDLDDEVKYSPESYTPTEQEQNLEEVLDSIRHSPSFQRTLDEVGSKWDLESRNILMENPILISKINEHIETGIYDQIMSVVESEKLMGRLNGLSDLAAYKTIGDALQANGKFAHLAKKSQPESKPAKDPKVVKARKRAAAPPKRSLGTGKPPAEFNPLSMSDDEFEKVAPSFMRHG